MKLIIGIIIALLIAAGLWFSMQTSSVPTETGDDASQVEAEKKDAPSRGTLASLFGMSGSYKCTVSSDAATGFARGIVYVKDGNVRGEFVTTSEDGEMTAMMVKSGDVMYTWSSAMPMGVKAKASAMEGTAETPTQESQMFDTGVAVDYSCAPTTVDDALFAPPADVEFMDMTSGAPAMPDISKMMR